MELFLIDPIFNEDKYQSVLIDMAKLTFSAFRQAYIETETNQSPRFLNAEYLLKGMEMMLVEWKIDREVFL